VRERAERALRQRRVDAVGEQCDDGNLANQDGCDAWCRVENFVGNGDFSANADRWQFYTNGVATFSTPAGEARVDIVVPGNNVQLYQAPIPLRATRCTASPSGRATREAIP